MRSRILILSGLPNDARELSQMLQDLPVILDFAENLQQARAKLLQEADYQAILTEASLPDGKWLDALHLVRECPQSPQVVVTSPQADARLWAEALNLGVYDVLAQPFYEPEVRRILSNACARNSHGAVRMAAV
jgi:DNA-binding NtrC family response regulator